MTRKNDTKIEEKLACHFKTDMMNLANFDPCTQKSKKFVLMGSLWAKYTTFGIKKYRGVIFHDTEDWFKIWKRNWLVIWKMTWQISKIFTRALESAKLETCMGSFCSQWTLYGLKVYRGVICHDTEE